MDFLLKLVTWTEPKSSNTTKNLINEFISRAVPLHYYSSPKRLENTMVILIQCNREIRTNRVSKQWLDWDFSIISYYFELEILHYKESCKIIIKRILLKKKNPLKCKIIKIKQNNEIAWQALQNMNCKINSLKKY